MASNKRYLNFISEQLFSLQDTAYRAFQSKPMPAIPPEIKQQLRGLRIRP